MDGSISYDSNSLQSYSPSTDVGIITNEINHTDIPDADLAIYRLAHANRSTIVNTNYPAKKITIAGIIKGNSAADIDSRIDTFKGYFRNKDKNLDITYGSGTRRYIATKNGVSIVHGKNNHYAQFEVEFVCIIPFGQDTSNSTALNATGRTAANYSDGHTFIGTAPAQQPVFTYTLTAVTGSTSKSVVFGNNATGQQITVTRTWANSDVLEIDVYSKTVKVNGNNVEFTGAFPEFDEGSGTIDYSDNFTTRTFSINVVYKAQYL